jgi:hypothetical protein
MTARVQNSGLARITAALAVLSWWIQWGTGSDAAASDNVVTAATTEARAAASAVQGAFNVTNDSLVLKATIVAASDVIITEVGVFDDAGAGSPPVGGNMVFYSDCGPITLNAGSSIGFTINLRLG